MQFFSSRSFNGKPNGGPAIYMANIVPYCLDKLYLNIVPYCLDKLF